MSSFLCEKCGKAIIDTPNGYVTRCEHYPLEIELKGNLIYPLRGKNEKKKKVKTKKKNQKNIGVFNN